MAIRYAEDGTASISSLVDVKIVEHTYYTVEGLNFVEPHLEHTFESEYHAESALVEALSWYGYPFESAKKVAQERRQDVQRR